MRDLQSFLQGQMEAGQILDWRRVEPKVGGRLQIFHPHDLSEDYIARLRKEIAAIEGCEPSWVEMLPRNASSDGSPT